MKRASLCGLVLLAACHGHADDAAPDLRPVLSTVIHVADGGEPAFVGTVEPRYATQLAFRVGGRVIRRSVSVGDHVKRGDEIAALDRRSLQLAVAAATADVRGGAATQANADTSFGRQTALLASRAAAQASLDDARNSQAAAAAAVDESQARLHKAQEELSYGSLRAELDGVITRVDFEVEQVVAANAVIAEMARPDVLDLVLDAPESAAQTLHLGDPFTARTDEPGAVSVAGTVRQVSPAADRTTRTRRVWIALATLPPDVRLGTTMYASRSVATPPPLRVPVTAVVGDAGAASVWVVEGDTVQPRPVTLGAKSGDDVVVASGLRDGDHVVTAGVHSLTPGQHIKTEQDAAP